MKPAKKTPSSRPAARSPARTNPPSTPAAAASPPADAKDSLASFERYSEIARRELGSEDVGPCNAPLDVLLANVQAALDAVLPFRDKIVERYPSTDFARFEAMPSIARAVILASTLASTSASEARQIAAKLAELRVWRPLLLAQLELLAHPRVGLASQKEVAAIRAGVGALDEARDAVALAALFTRDRAKLAGKHPFSDETIQEVRALGDWLLSQLRSSRSAIDSPAKASPRNPYAEHRDRLWALLVRRHDELQRAATAVFSMREVAEKIPSLHAQSPRKRSKEQTVSDEPR